MKPFLAAALALFALAAPAAAETLTWAGPYEGIWNTTDNNWTNDQSASVPWANTGGDEAVLDQIVKLTVEGTVNLSALRFTAGGYLSSYHTILTGGTLNFGDTRGLIDSSATEDDTVTDIASNLTGQGGLTIRSNVDPSSRYSGIILSGDNTGLTGGISITSGVVHFASQQAAGQNTITLDGGGIDNSNSGNSTLSNNLVIGSAGGVFFSLGTGNLALTGKISGSGDIVLKAPIVLWDDLSDYTGTLRHEDGSLSLKGDDTTIRHYHISAVPLGSLIMNSLSIDPDATVTANLVTGNILNQLGGHLVLDGANTHTDTIVDGDGATLTIGNGGAAGTLGNGYVRINTGTTLRFNRSDSYEAANRIWGEGDVEIVGGRVILSGANEYAGTTTVREGAALVAAHNFATGNALSGTSDLILEQYATLIVAYGITLQGIADLQAAGATIVLSDKTSMLSVNGILDLYGATLDLTGFSEGTYDLNTLFGTTDYDFAAANLAISTSYLHQWLDSSRLWITSAIPEPSAALLGLIACASLLRRRRVHPL